MIFGELPEKGPILQKFSILLWVNSGFFTKKGPLVIGALFGLIVLGTYWVRVGVKKEGLYPFFGGF